MYKIILALLLTFGLLPLGFGQSMTQVIASSIEDAGGNKLASGSVCFQPLLPKNSSATSFAPGGGGIVYPRTVCAAVTNGAITPITLASSLFTSPVGVVYQITVTDTNTTESWILGSASVSGATWSLDAFIPGATFTFYPNAPSNVSGTLSVTGDITAPKFHGTADFALAADHWANLPNSCPAGMAPTSQDIHGNWLNCVTTSFQASGTTPGVIAQNPTGNQMITVPSGAFQRIGGASSYTQFDQNGAMTTPAISALTVNGVQYASLVGLTQAVTNCSTGLCTIEVGTSIPVTANLAVPSNVTLRFIKGGQFNIASGIIATINGAIQAPDDAPIFVGAGAVAFGLGINYPHVEWFGAVGDWNGTSGTDNTVFIQKCVNSLINGQCILAAKQYGITSALNFHKSNVGLRGVSSGLRFTPQYPNPSSSVIVSTSASATILDVEGTSTTNNIAFNKFEHFTLDRSATPTISTTSAFGMFNKYTYGVVIDDVTVEDSATAFYFHAVGSQGQGYVSNSAALWGFDGIPYPNTAGNLCGFCIDSDNGEPSPSLRIHDVLADSGLGVSSPINTTGLWIHGIATPDAHVRAFETAGLTFGMVVNGGGGASTDIHIWDSINDNCLKSCIVVNGVNGPIEFSGGWNYRGPNPGDATSAGAEIMNSSNVQLHSMQFYFINAPTGPGIHVNGGGNVLIADNSFIGKSSAIFLEHTSSDVVTGNTMAGVSGAPSVITLTVSSDNVIVGNTINGTAPNGIQLDASSVGNKGLDTNIIVGSITTPILDLGANLEQTRYLSGSMPVTIAGSSGTATCVSTCSATGGVVLYTATAVLPIDQTAFTITHTSVGHTMNCVVGANNITAANGAEPWISGISDTQVTVAFHGGASTIGTPYQLTYLCF